MPYSSPVSASQYASCIPETTTHPPRPSLPVRFCPHLHCLRAARVGKQLDRAGLRGLTLQSPGFCAWDASCGLVGSGLAGSCGGQRSSLSLPSSAACSPGRTVQLCCELESLSSGSRVNGWWSGPDASSCPGHLSPLSRKGTRYRAGSAASVRDESQEYQEPTLLAWRAPRGECSMSLGCLGP